MLIPKASYIIIVPFPPRSITFIPRISELSFGQLQWSIMIRLISKKHMTMDTLSSTKQLNDYTCYLVLTVGISMASKPSFHGGMEMED